MAFQKGWSTASQREGMIDPPPSGIRAVGPMSVPTPESGRSPGEICQGCTTSETPFCSGKTNRSGISTCIARWAAASAVFQ
jgi:hypothetical protein